MPGNGPQKRKKKAPAERKKKAPLGLTTPSAQRHEAFCRAYVRHWNAGAAWKEARGGTEDRATPADRTHGSLLLTRADIQARVAELVREQEAAWTLNAERVRKELEAMLAADPADLFDEEGRLRPIREIPRHLRKAIRALDLPKGKVTLVDRKGLLELVGRHIDVQAWKDKLDVNVTTLEELLAGVEQKGTTNGG